MGGLLWRCASAVRALEFDFLNVPQKEKERDCDISIFFQEIVFGIFVSSAEFFLLSNTHLSSENFPFAFAVTSQATFRVCAFDSTNRKFSTLLLTIGLSFLTGMLWFEFSGIYFEEVNRLLWVLASNIMEGTGGDVVRLALSN
jgi:hypothetical protein